MYAKVIYVRIVYNWFTKSSSVLLAQHKFDANSNNNNNNIHNKNDMCWFPIENRNCWNDKRYDKVNHKNNMNENKHVRIIVKTKSKLQRKIKIRFVYMYVKNRRYV